MSDDGFILVCDGGGQRTGRAVVSLVFHSAVHITGRQLLFSGGGAWLTDAIAFGLAFWELDIAIGTARG